MIPDDSALFGRSDVVEQLRGAAMRSTPGSPSVAIIEGEAGSGKSRLLGRLCRDLRSEGWRVAVGHCPEIDGAPAAWAWSEALRSLAAETDPAQFHDLLAPLLLDDVDARTTDALTDRFRMHRAVTQWLSTMSDQPLLLVLDDVHRADRETRHILMSVLDTPIAAQLFIATAHRPEASPQLDELLADVARYAPERVHLEGLGRTDAAALVAGITGHEIESELLDLLLERTDGNPFFLEEIARLIVSAGPAAALGVPAGVADVIRSRIARLPDQAIRVLRVASVAGRLIDTRLLDKVLRAEPDVLLTALELGLEAGLLVEDVGGQLRFAHVLIRDALYADIPLVRRVAWHAEVAAAIEVLHPDEVVALAFHSVQAATPATSSEAAARCVRAAELAERRFAYDVAAKWLSEASTCLALAEADQRGQVEILLRLVPDLVRSGDSDSVLAVRRQAVELSAQLADERLLVRAIACWNVPSVWLNRPYGHVDADFVALIDRTLRRPTLTDRERCLLLNTRLRETSYSDDPRSTEMAMDTLRIARRSGEADLLALSLVSATEVFLADLDAPMRDEIREELRDLAVRHDLAGYRLLADIFDAHSAATFARLGEYRHKLESADVLARALGLRQATFAVAAMRAGFACMIGDHRRAEAAYRALYEAWRRAGGGPNAENYWALALFTLRQTEGCLDDVVDLLRLRLEQMPELSAAKYARCLVAVGRIDEARGVFATAASPRRDFQWVGNVASIAQVAIALADRDWATSFYPQLLPVERVIIGAVSGCPAGPVAQVLGELARFLGRPEMAREHFQNAAEIADRCGNPYWIRQIEADLAALDG